MTNNPEREAFEAWYDSNEDTLLSFFDVWQAGAAWQREKNAADIGDEIAELRWRLEGLEK